MTKMHGNGRILTWKHRSFTGIPWPTCKDKKSLWHRECWHWCNKALELLTTGYKGCNKNSLGAPETLVFFNYFVLTLMGFLSQNKEAVTSQPRVTIILQFLGKKHRRWSCVFFFTFQCYSSLTGSSTVWGKDTSGCLITELKSWRSLMFKHIVKHFNSKVV